ncbi:MAG: GspH/FimT family pseudopilin [Gallionella sp.]|nr:GspH/FimT family pseudopilin [Gallionella sp.]
MLNAFPVANPPVTRPRGFSLVEMLIVIAIIAIATTLGMPSYRAWVHNTQIRNAAESIQNGMQKARAEAVKRNANIECVLGANPPWIIKLVGDIVAQPELEIERASNEGAKNATATATPAGATTITFSNLGTVVANADATDTLTQVDLDSSVLSAADSRNLRVTIGVAGNVRMCDPDPGLAASDPRKC